MEPDLGDELLDLWDLFYWDLTFADNSKLRRVSRITAFVAESASMRASRIRSTHRLDTEKH
jgi:hypothetical protein